MHHKLAQNLPYYTVRSEIAVTVLTVYNMRTLKSGTIGMVPLHIVKKLKFQISTAIATKSHVVGPK